MINRAERQHLALALRRLASGRISCDEFDEACPARTNDPAVKVISDYGWGLYSEGDERLTGSKALSAEELRRVARCVLSLQTERHYEWPPRPWWTLLDPLYIVTRGRLGFGAAAERRWRDGVDWEAWPFRNPVNLTTVAARWPFARAV